MALAVSGKPDSRVGQRRLLRPGWPLYVVFVGFPFWWILGMAGFIWPIVAIPMLLSLFRRQRITAPPAFILWIGFMVWMLFTSVELDTAGRVLGFAYRSACYLSATILLLYVYNSATELLETRKILWIMSVFWIYVVIGGFLGLMFPSFSFTSPVESILPRSLLANDFVKLMVHPTFAEVQNFLGFATPRPSAPFVYTNDWGGAYALLTPFMILALGSKLRRRFKTILVATAIASVIPVVLSLNRGLWLSLGLGLMYASFRLALRGRERAIVISVVSVCIVTGLVIFTPLKGLIDERLAVGHSNNRRTSLYEESIRGAMASPLFGFGAPRPSTWNPNAPSVGTQGQLWLVLFSHGFIGAFFFLAFFLVTFWKLRRLDLRTSFWCHVLLLMMLVQLPVYDFLPHQFHIVMLAIAVAWRERRSHGFLSRPIEPPLSRELVPELSS
jgi:polysaccharide biosynthesis protein PslJ